MNFGSIDMSACVGFGCGPYLFEIAGLDAASPDRGNRPIDTRSERRAGRWDQRDNTFSCITASKHLKHSMVGWSIADVLAKSDWSIGNSAHVNKQSQSDCLDTSCREARTKLCFYRCASADITVFDHSEHSHGAECIGSW